MTIVFKITVNVNNIDMCMELDTGSGTSVISETYLLNFSDFILHKSDLKMCLYNGHKITHLGYFIAKISCSGLGDEIKIYVIENGGPPL